MSRGYTDIYQNPSIDLMRACALKLFDSIQWRHHGIGVLQGYVRENVDTEIRMHIWHKSLLKDGMDVSGDIHDHRLDMVSHVLCGKVRHEEIEPVPDDNGTFEMLLLTHARAAADTNYHGPTSTMSGTFSVQRNPMMIFSGQSYRFPALHFHHSPLDDDNSVAVSIVEKHNQHDVRARILYPRDYPPIMAFGHDMDLALVNSVIAIAKRELESA